MPTTQISLVREHSEAIRPPRALWVPFELGRPLGAPGHPEFQADVLRRTLALLERSEGPVLEDFDREAPDVEEAELEGWVCALPLPPAQLPDDPVEALRVRLRDEIRHLRPWYDEARREAGRTSVGVSGLDVNAMEAIGDALVTVSAGGNPVAPAGAAVPLPMLIRYMADDIKTYYFEAAAAQPAARKPTSKELGHWLFRESVLGGVLYDARDALLAKPEPADQLPGRGLIPVAFGRRA